MRRTGHQAFGVVHAGPSRCSAPRIPVRLELANLTRLHTHPRTGSPSTNGGSRSCKRRPVGATISDGHWYSDTCSGATNCNGPCTRRRWCSSSAAANHDARGSFPPSENAVSNCRGSIDGGTGSWVSSVCWWSATDRGADGGTYWRFGSFDGGCSACCCRPEACRWSATDRGAADGWQ